MVRMGLVAAETGNVTVLALYRANGVFTAEKIEEDNQGE